MKVVVQRNAYAQIIPRPFQNEDVLRPVHSDLQDMNGVEPLMARLLRKRRESLVKQNARHATRSTVRRSSSTVAAA